jgi:hypothetical protein
MIGERQLMEDTQMRTGERAGHHHKSRLMIGNKSKRETDEGRQVKSNIPTIGKQMKGAM